MATEKTVPLDDAQGTSTYQQNPSSLREYPQPNQQSPLTYPAHQPHNPPPEQPHHQPPQHQHHHQPPPGTTHYGTQYPIYPPAGPSFPPGPPPNTEPGPTLQLDQVQVVPYHATPNDLTKSATLAVILCVPILGMLGLHHFYLNRRFFGCVYACTLGLFALGWLIDWFRIRSLVKKCNDQARDDQIRGYQLRSPKYPFPLTKISLCDAYMLWLPPVGLFGVYQYYLGRRRYGIYHTATLGRAGLGWLLDFCRLPAMVRRANAEIAMMRKGVRVSEPPYSVCDAYTLAFPLGIFGLHHFYLGNTRRGLLFLCTVGVFGLGWLADMFQMPMIVAEANKNRELTQRLAGALANNEQLSQQTTTVIVVPATNEGYVAGPGGPSDGAMAPGASGVTSHANEPPPAYRAQAGEGEQVLPSACPQPKGKGEVV